MKRYLITLNIVTNSKKINAIRDLRGATGMGLGASKDFVETQLPGFLDSFGGELIVNAEQLADLLVLSLREQKKNGSWSELNPTFNLTRVELITAGAVDISSLRQMEV